MHLDVVDLRSFYYRTPLGRSAQSALQSAVRDLWPSVKGETVVGFGFAAPLLRPMMGEAARMLCLMPAPQGVCRWPPEGPNLSALVEETHWPLPAGFADRLIVAHGVENSERPAALLEEMHRVLAPEGKAIVIVPNRTGVWARTEGTPFGHGRPYTSDQLEALLRAHDFEPERVEAALYAPPSRKRFWLRTGRMLERAGRRLSAGRLAGAVLVEATRRSYAVPRPGLKERALSPIEVLEGLAGGRPKPVRGASRGLAARGAADHQRLGSRGR